MQSFFPQPARPHVLLTEDTRFEALVRTVETNCLFWANTLCTPVALGSTSSVSHFLTMTYSTFAIWKAACTTLQRLTRGIFRFHRGRRIVHVHPAIEPGPPYSMLTTAHQHRKSRSLVLRCAVACLALAAFLLGVAPSTFAQTCTNPQNPPSIQDCIWSDTAVPGTLDDGGTSSIEVGVKFTANVNGNVSGIRFYKSTANTCTHVGNLWSSAGTLLATATFASETASSWQQVNFSTPVAIIAGTTYVASYCTSVGHTADDHGYFTNSGFSNGPLQALQSSLSGGNGVYITSSQSAFPTNDNQDSNYWVDVVFLPTMNLTFDSSLIMGGTS